METGGGRKQKKTVSVIVPVYNVKRYIKECLWSIAGQSYLNIEAIVVDDGSWDGSGALCDEIAAKYPNMSIIHQENQGVAKARKRGVNAAKGEYVCFVDADDFIEPDYCLKLMQRIEDYDLLITCSYPEYGIDGKAPYGSYKTEKEMAYIYKNMMMYGDTKEHGLAPYICDKLFRADIAKNVFEEINEDIYLSEDAEFLYRYVLKCSSLRISSSVCGYHYRKRRDSATYSVHERYLINYNNLYLSLKGVFENHPQEERLMMQLQKWMSKMIYNATRVMGFDVSTQIIGDIFPFQNILKGKNIVLYGAGYIGQMYYRQIIYYRECDIVLWVDKKYVEYKKMGVRPIDEIKKKAFDFVVIAVESEMLAMEIRNSLIADFEIENEKIVWKESRSAVI